MPRVEALRGPYELVGGLMHFGRMVDKMRLHAVGNLRNTRPFSGKVIRRLSMGVFADS